MPNNNTKWTNSLLDVLFAHPQPEPFESLTGYLLRIAQNNFLTSADAVSALLFPDQNRRTIRTYADFPPLKLDDLSKATVCEIPRLLQSTFRHIGLKFGRSTKPQPLGRFLGETVANRLRYCPKCIAGHGYYRLTWRFQFLTGCVEHSCHLLDHCSHCGNPIPFISTPPKIGVCPSCGGDLSNCVTTALSDAEAWEAAITEDDLQFLLTPHPYEYCSNEIVIELGVRLAAMRLERGLTITELASEIGVSQNMVEGMEWGKIVERGATFASYKRYADYLGTTLKALFHKAAEPRPLYKSAEDILREKVDRALASLQSLGEPITQAAVARMAETSVGAMCWYPNIVERVRQAKEEQAIHAENELIRQVQNAVKARCWERKPISQEKIAKDIGASRAAIRKSAQATDIIRKAKHERS